MLVDDEQGRLNWFFSQRHPMYETLCGSVWRKMYLAFQGGASFKESFLWRGDGESDDDWRERLGRSVYENHLQDVINRREGIVFSRKIKRSARGKGLDTWKLICGDFDLLGTPRQDFIRECFRLSQVFGYLPVLVDKQNVVRGEPRQEEQAAGLRPYAVPIPPGDMLNWRVGERRQLDWVVLRCGVERRGSMWEENEEVTVYRIVDREKIDVWEELKDDRGRKYYRRAEGAPFVHDLGIVPMAILRDLSRPGEPVFGMPSLLSSAEQSIALFNYMNWSEEVAFLTNYNFLAAEDDARSGHGMSEEKQIVTGPRFVFWYPQGGNPPQWVSPPTGAIEIYRAEIKDMRRRVYELAQLDAGHPEDSREHLSGAAYGHRSRETEEMARRLAQSLESFEYALDEIMMQCWEGYSNFRSSIVYPRRFGIRATQEAIKELLAVESLNSIPAEAKRVLARNFIYTEAFAELEDEDLERLERMIGGHEQGADARE